MKPSIEEQKAYWDKTWDDRCDEKDKRLVSMNKEKMTYLVSLLAQKPYYVDLKKLDVGCGTCIHHGFLTHHYPSWPDKLDGIDLSEKAVKRARYFGFNAHAESFYNVAGQYDAFFFMDSLEHFDNLELVIDKLWDLGRGDYYIFGNIPLYASSDHAIDGGFERSMSIDTMRWFFGELKFKGFWQKVYGSFGYPYMVFEGRKNNIIGGQDEGTISLP